MINARPSFPLGTFVGESNSTFAKFVFEKRPTPKRVLIAAVSFHGTRINRNGVTIGFSTHYALCRFLTTKNVFFFFSIVSIYFAALSNVARRIIRPVRSVVSQHVQTMLTRYFKIVFPPPVHFSNLSRNCRLPPIPT